MTTCRSVKNPFQLFKCRDSIRKKIFFTSTFAQVFILFFFFILCAPAAGAVMSLPYHQHLDLNFKQVIFELEKSTGPLEVEFSAQPLMITDQKIVFSGENDMTGRSITVTRPDETAQFTITVKNKNTGQILLEKGFGGVYDSSKTTQKYTIHDEGPYIFDLQGKKIEADLSIRPQNYIAPTATITSESAYSQPPAGVTRVTFVAVANPTSSATRTTYAVARTTSKSSTSSSASTNSLLRSAIFRFARVRCPCVLRGGIYVLYTKSQTASQGPVYIPPSGSPPVSIPPPDDAWPEPPLQPPLPEPPFQPPPAPQPKIPAVSVMDDIPRQKLKEILRKFGTGLISNPKKVKGLLLDYCPSQRSGYGGNFQKEIHLLILAINQNIPQDLLATSLNEPFAFKRGRLQKRLTDLAVEESAAAWAVDAWAEALGLGSGTRI
jgi:hypothetical protein